MTIKTECSSCRGTGLYRGLAEIRTAGLAVICIDCSGSGCREVSYEPFVNRRQRTDVTTVQRSRGTFIAECGPVGRPISYQQFLDGQMP